MKYLSLFSGIGGFELGIGPEHECIGYSEIDKYAIQIYQKQFPKHKNYGDITKINERELPDFDFLCGGFPCQSFSIAGKRGGFADTRGTLFFDIARILKHKQPKLFLLENVKGLLSHDEGRTFTTIISTLDELGYDLQWQVLNSKSWVPQNRERIFIIGNLRGKSRPKIFPFSTDNSFTKGAREEKRKAVAHTLRAKLGGPDFENSYLIDLKSPMSDTRRGMISRENFTKTLDHDCAQGIGYENSIRQLTPLECERLQGFPDNWMEGISVTQRKKCLGNAVTVNVIKAIMEKLL